MGGGWGVHQKAGCLMCVGAGGYEDRYGGPRSFDRYGPPPEHRYGPPRDYPPQGALCGVVLCCATCFGGRCAARR